MAELDARKRRILSAVVDSYTRTGEPVGSKLISEMLGGQFSSATIRNDMAVLFDMGLLEQPHTSAGRIPSHLGYRVYLNQLMQPEPLTTREKREIEALFNRRNPDPNRLLEDAAKALAGYTPQNNRSQLKQTAHNTLIIDAYNANPTSMIASIGNFKKMNASQKLLILGDMRELGKESAEEHQKVVDYLEACAFDEVWLVGSEFAQTRHTYPHFPDAATLIAWLQTNRPTGKTILIKGSNGIKLSSIIDYL